MKKQLYNITVKLCHIVFPNSNSLNYLNQYFKLLNRLINTQGLVKTVAYLKACRLHCTRYMCGSPLLFNKLKIGVDSDGWPKQLLFLKPLANGSLEEKKLLLTILCLSRTLKPEGKEKSKIKPDYDSITKPGKIEKTIPTGFIKEFVKRYNLHMEKPKFEMSNIYLSNKAGPNGKATKSCYNSLLSYSYYLMASIFKITDQAGIEYFQSQYNYAWEKNFPSQKLGKLSFIYDPECKLRIVAIVDYYTQLFLKPIHEKIMKKLQNLPCDRTFTQDPLNNWKDDGNMFWSIDLSSATDRFPISLQRRLLEISISKEVADGWSFILSDRKFETPEGNLVQYRTGQPMGSYSSWAAFTLTHHLVLHWCAKLCGYDKFTDYIILGDDIVIKNDEVAKKYMKWMAHLGVELSPSKTHVSKDTYEFAKRWFCKGREITGLPMNGIVENINNPFIVMVNLYDFYKVKGNYLGSTKNLPCILSSLYKGLSLKLSKRFNNSRFKMKIYTFHKSLDYSFGYLTYDSLRELLCLNITNEQFMIPEGQLIHKIYDEVVVQGMGSSVKNSMASLSGLASKVIDGKTIYDLEDPNELRNYPIFKGIVNYINNYKDSVSKWDVNSSNYRQKSKELLMLNIDNVFGKERNKTLELLNTGKIFSLGFKKINETDEIMYGSSIGESSFSYSSDLFNLISNNYSISLNKLDQLDKGTYTENKVKTPQSAYDAYANFFN